MDDDTLTAELRKRFVGRFGGVLELHVAREALYALTMLEREPPDLIVSGKQLGDMSGLEFHEIIRDDASTKALAFILLDSDAPPLEPAHLAISLDERAHPADVLRATFELLAERVPDDRNRPREGPPPAASPVRRGDAKVSGTLEIFTLFDLVVSLTQKKNSGYLFVSLGDYEALMRLDQGCLVHAEFGGLTGEAAVVRIFAAADTHHNAEFRFEPSSVPVPRGDVTIHATVQELLLKVAVELDHEREAARLTASR